MTRTLVIEHLPCIALVNKLAAVRTVIEIASRIAGLGVSLANDRGPEIKTASSLTLTP